MHIPIPLATSLAVFGGISRLALGVALGVAPSCAVDEGRTLDDLSVSDDTSGEQPSAMPVCTTGTIRCHALIRTVGTSQRTSSHLTAPVGFGPPDLQQAYNIDPSNAVPASPTVAIVDAYGYSALESDLAAYRSHYGLPTCTIANGCLETVNQQGQATPLPANPPASDDWTIETALDVDMVSAACPRCKILVVQATDNLGNGLYIAQNTAAALGATVISDSWGGPEQPDTPASSIAANEAYFDHPNIAIFVAAGDHGYNDLVVGPGNPTGPDYPGTSAHTIAVGGTHLVRDTSARGWSETTWAPTARSATGAGGSACSLSIPKPAYQTASPCPFKATTDIAAVADQATGVAVYNAGQGGWITVGGTSASAPLVAAIFAATGNGAQASGAFIAANASKLHDVVSGTNGTCPADRTLLCNAAVGWDGPTGHGTPNAAALASAGDPGASDGSPVVTGGCSMGRGAGTGGLLGIALLGLRRRRPVARPPRSSAPDENRTRLLLIDNQLASPDASGGNTSSVARRLGARTNHRTNARRVSE